MIRAIKKAAPQVTAIIVLVAIAAVVSGYILAHERFRFPLIDESPFVVKAEFQTAQAVTAGQGQTVRVSGVRIGDIGDVNLVDGKAVVDLEIDRKYASLIHSDASALLRPKTGLKDMFVELDPGSAGRPVEENFVIPLRNTLPDVNPDEFLSALDTDTRDYLQLLIDGAGKGLAGRGGDLRDVLARFEPTHRDLARVSSAVATRRHNLRRLIHSLNELNTELASKGKDLTELVSTSAQVFNAFASEQQNVSAAVRELPGALSQTTDTLGRVQTLAQVLRPAADRLRAPARRIPAANESLRRLAKQITPLLRSDIRPFVREARPLVRDLRPAATDLAKATPDLTKTFGVLNNLFDLIAYNPNGAEPPDTDGSRQEGYLFWIAWINHMASYVFSSSDAHGTFRPVTLAAPCSTIKEIVAGRPELEGLLGLTPLLTDPVCAK